MANLPTRSYATIVQNIVAGIQGRTSALIDFSVGSPLRAIVEAYASAGLWLQALALQIAKAARLATAKGADVDSFVADFKIFRLPEAYASGYVTYSRFTASTTSPFIPVGATVQTSDGTQNFIVVADLSNPAYSASLGGFSMPSGALSITLKVQSLASGTGSNVSAGTVTVMTSPIAGVDTVTNGAAFTGGMAAEKDAALKARFALNILGLARGNYYGAAAALANLNVSIQYQIVDGFQYNGAPSPGFFYCVVDDGTGSPSSDFIAGATAAVQAVKPLGVQFAIYPPVIVSANVGLTLTTLPGYLHSNVVAQAASLIAANIAALGLGAGMDAYQIAAWALSVPGVAPGGVSSLTLNGLSGDYAVIAASPNNRIMPGTIAVA